MFQKPTVNTHTDKEHTSNQHDEVETVVGPSVVVEGDFASEGNIIVKGTVSGSVKTSKLLTVEKGAKILASVKAGSAKVAGSIKGNVKVNDRLDLTETSQVAGDIVCKVLNIEAGALVQGKISMKGIEIKSEGGEGNGLFGKVKTKKVEVVKK
jgi:cytoskeletal protein CcmA (bactofilin family)